MTVRAAGTYAAFVGVPTGGTTIGTYHLSITVFPAANEGVNCTTYTSTNVPVTIPDGPGLVTSTITVPGNPRIADIDVSIDLTHRLHGRPGRGPHRARGATSWACSPTSAR